MTQSSLPELIARANSDVLSRMTRCRPRLVDIQPLHEICDRVTGMVLTHSGPPATWKSMSGAQRGAVVGAMLFEGWAETPEAAGSMMARGEVALIPNHDLGGVGPMGGVMSPNMHVYVVEDEETHLRAYSCTEFDAFFGAFDAAAIDEIRVWNSTVYPSMARAVRSLGGVDLRAIMAKALTMGDELHSRQTASSALLLATLASAIARICPAEESAVTLQILAESDLSFLPLSMAACKISSLAASDVDYSTVVTVMTRNGTDFGIRVSGLGDTWFCAPAPAVEGVFFPGFGRADAGLDVGDSAITETLGLGAFSLAAAPSMSGLTGVGIPQLNALSGEMAEICVGRHPGWSIPQLEFGGPPIGIDIRKVLQQSIFPMIDTATAHKDAGHRIIGAGITRAPEQCFHLALDAWLERYAKPEVLVASGGTDGKQSREI